MITPVMNIAQLIPIAVQVSMVLIIFCIGLHATMRHVTYLLRTPGLLFRSVMSMNLIMPVFAVALAMMFDLNHVLEVALIALALSPVPPLLPNKELKAGGAPSYAIGVVVATALLSIVFVPVAAELLGRFFERPVHVSLGTVAKIVLTSVLAPLLAGVCFRLLAPIVADKIARPLSIFGTVLLVVASCPS